MKTGQASRTAEHNALFRTLEASVPDGQALFRDPLAPAFLTWPMSLAGRLADLPGGGRALRWSIDRYWPGVRTSVVARTRLIDDTLASLDGGRLAQLVILGAGFDSRPYRLAFLRNVAVFEVDHPDTQRAKREALSEELGALPDNVRFISSDFNLDRLGPSMAAAGYRSNLPSVFLWEGVSNYLSEEAVDATVRWCAEAAYGSLLLFTYINADVLDHPERYRGAERLQATLHKVDERLTFGMEPAEMNRYLAARGLTSLWDLGAADYRARYFGDRAQSMKGHEFYRVALARVGGSPASAPFGEGDQTRAGSHP